MQTPRYVEIKENIKRCSHSNRFDAKWHPCLKFRTNSGLRKLSETVRNQGGFCHPDFIRSSPELVRSTSSELESELNPI